MKMLVNSWDGKFLPFKNKGFFGEKLDFPPFQVPCYLADPILP